MANINISKLKKFNTNTFMIHSADEKLTVSHIDFWINTLNETQVEYSILVRDENSYKKLTKLFPQLQICYAKNPIDVESVVNSQQDLTTVLYTTNLAKNIHLLRFNHLKHIFIGTKNSEWLSQFNKSYRAYDEIWCGGDFLINRIKTEIGNTGHLNFKIVGKPQLKELFSKSNHKEKKSSIVIINNKDELLLEKIYYVHNTLNNKFFIYLSKENELIKNNLLNVAKTHGYTNKIKIFDNKELIDEFATRVSYVIVDLNNLNPYLLNYNVPIVVYIEKEYLKYTLEPSVLQECLYFFSNKSELQEILSELDQNKDTLREKRENISNQFFNKEVILNNVFIKNINKLKR